MRSRGRAAGYAHRRSIEGWVGGQMAQVTRDNHYVPQAYLGRWADEAGYVHRYRLLVSDARVPRWMTSPVRGLAARKDLYTLTEDDRATDEFERWFEQEFETPAQEAIEKAVSGARLKLADWQRLTLYCVVQDLRTPRTYHELTSRFASNFDDVLGDVVDRMKRAIEQGLMPQQASDPQLRRFGSIEDAIQVTIDPDAHPERDEGEIVVRGLAGRRLWLNEVKRLTEGVVGRAALGHEWSIVEPASGMRWITSDHPVARLNFYGDGKYDLRGGWGRRGGNILMPLSPTCLLYTEIGTRNRRRFQLPPDLTSLIRRILVDNAMDDVFAAGRDREVLMWRPRVVDPDAYAQREKAWERWHEDQDSAEQSFLNDQPQSNPGVNPTAPREVSSGAKPA